MPVERIELTKDNYSTYASYTPVMQLKDYVQRHGVELTVHCGNRDYHMTPAVAEALN